MMKKILIASFISLVLLFTFLQHRFLSFASGYAAKFYASHYLEDVLTYEKAELEGNVLILSRPSLAKNRLAAESLMIAFEFDSTVREINLAVRLDRPTWKTGEIITHNKLWSSFLQSKRAGWAKINSNWKIDNGLLKWDAVDKTERVLNFDLEFHHLFGGRIKAYCDPADRNGNYFTLNLESQSDAMLLKWNCSQLGCDSAFKLLSLVYPTLESCIIESGSMDGEVIAFFPADRRPFLEGGVTLENLAFIVPEKKLRGTIKKSQLKLLGNERTSKDWRFTTIGKYNILEAGELVGQSEGEGAWGLNGILGFIEMDENKTIRMKFEAQSQSLGEITPCGIRLEGHANLDAHHFFDADIDLICSSSTKPDGSVKFLIFQPEGSLKIAEMKCERLSYTEWGFIQKLLVADWPDFKEIEFQSGELNALATADFTKSGFENIQFRYFDVNDLRFSIASKNAVFFFPKWGGHGSLDPRQKDIWKSLDAEIILEEGSVHLEGLLSNPFKDVGTKLTIEKGQIHHSIVKMQLGGLKGLVDIDWTDGKRLLAVHLTGKGADLGELLPESIGGAVEKNFRDQSLTVQATISGGADGLEVEGSLHVRQNSESPKADLIHFGYRLEKNVQGNYFFNPVGWFHAKNLPLERFISPFLFPREQATLRGVGEILGSFDTTQVSVKYGAQKMQMENNDLLIDIQEMHLSNPAELTGVHAFNLKTRSHEGVLPVKNATYLEKNTGLFFEVGQGVISFKDQTVRLKATETSCEGILMAGQVDLDYGDPAPGVFTVEVTIPSLNGKVSRARGLISHFKKASFLTEIPLEGDLESRDGGLQLKFNFVPKEYDLDGCFKGVVFNGSLPFADLNLAIQDLSMDVSYVHPNKRLDFTDLQGCLSVGKSGRSEEYVIAGHRIAYEELDGQVIHADFEVAGKECPLLRVAGIACVEEDSTMRIRLDKTLSHFCSIHPNEFKLSMKGFSKVELLELHASFRLQDIWSNATSFLVRTGWFFPERLLDKITLVESAGGDFTTILNYNDSDNALNYEIQGREAIFNDSHYGSFHLNGKKWGDRWSVDRFGLGELALSADMEHETDGWKFNFLSVSYGPSFILGLKGKFFEGRGVFESSVHLLEWNLKDFNQLECFQKFASQWDPKGVLRGKGNLNILFLNEAPWYRMEGTVLASFKDPEINLFPLAITEALKVDFKSEPGSHWLNINLDGGRYMFKNRECHLKDLTFLMTPGRLGFSASSLIERCPFSIVGTCELSDTIRGVVSLADAYTKFSGVTPPLSITWEDLGDGAKVRSIHGDFCGLSCDLIGVEGPRDSQKSLFRGDIRLDCDLIPYWLSEKNAELVDSLQIGRFFNLKGEYWLNPEFEEGLLDQLCFCADLSAQRIGFKGYAVDRVDACLNYCQGSLETTKIQVRDKAGVLECSQMMFKKDSETGEWFFSSPEILVKNCKLGLLQGGSYSNHTKFKALHVRRLGLENLFGQLGDTSTWRCDGFLHFLNPSRKNTIHPLLVIPAEIILRLGLDPHVLNPVTGMIYFNLAGDRFYLTKFKDVYSEGRGSKFYLAGKSPSWIDMNGNLSIQIRMRQYNLIFKIAELFTVSIQGNMKKPRYSLHKIEK
jgi:hypothetical protein